VIGIYVLSVLFRNIYRNTSLSNAEYSFSTFSRFFIPGHNILDAVEPMIVKDQRKKMWKMEGYEEITTKKSLIFTS
jgi:hypothetical protein